MLMNQLTTVVGHNIESKCTKQAQCIVSSVKCWEFMMERGLLNNSFFVLIKLYFIDHSTVHTVIVRCIISSFFFYIIGSKKQNNPHSGFVQIKDEFNTKMIRVLEADEESAQ